MARTLHLHAGFPKCGSSTLQSYLYDNRKSLLEAGYDYLALHKKRSGNLTPFIKSLHRPDPVFLQYNKGFSKEGALKDLKSGLKKSNADNVILSSESLISVPANHDISFLWDCFDRVQVHLFCRSRPQWIASSYTQSVKNGRLVDELGVLWGQKSYRAELTKKFSLMRYINLWRGLVGQENTKVYCLGHSFPDVTEQFLDALGLSELPLVKTVKDTNTSPSGFVTCVLASLERKDQKDFFEKSRNASDIARKHDPFPDRGVLSDLVARKVTRHFENDTTEFLDIFNEFKLQDLEPDVTRVTEKSVGFEEVRGTLAFRAVKKELAERGILMNW